MYNVVATQFCLHLCVHVSRYELYNVHTHVHAQGSVQNCLSGGFPSAKLLAKTQ